MAYFHNDGDFLYSDSFFPLLPLNPRHVKSPFLPRLACKWRTCMRSAFDGVPKRCRGAHGQLSEQAQGRADSRDDWGVLVMFEPGAAGIIAAFIF